MWAQWCSYGVQHEVRRFDQFFVEWISAVDERRLFGILKKSTKKIWCAAVDYCISVSLCYTHSSLAASSALNTPDTYTLVYTDTPEPVIQSIQYYRTQ